MMQQRPTPIYKTGAGLVIGVALVVVVAIVLAPRGDRLPEATDRLATAACHVALRARLPPSPAFAYDDVVSPPADASDPNGRWLVAGSVDTRRFTCDMLWTGRRFGDIRTTIR